MPNPSQFLEYVLEQLEPLGSIESKSMFGGYGIYLDDAIFAITSNDQLWLKADDENRESFTKLGMKPFRPYRDNNTVMPYYAVPPATLDDQEELLKLAKPAVEAGLRSRHKKHAD